MSTQILVRTPKPGDLFIFNAKERHNFRAGGVYCISRVEPVLPDEPTCQSWKLWFYVPQGRGGRLPDAFYSGDNDLFYLMRSPFNDPDLPPPDTFAHARWKLGWAWRRLLAATGIHRALKRLKRRWCR